MSHTAGSATAPVKRYAFVGTGHRAEMFFASLLGEHADVGAPVALCDLNRTRMGYYQDLLRAARPDAEPLPTYDASAFEEMLDTEKPDGVVVTTMDSTHAHYITTALDHGCEVICEKPLTTDEEGCRRIAEAVERNDGDLVLTFNYRYSPRNSAVKQLLVDGAIGQVTSVVFEWLLDTVHGADYFRRWHREKKNSGGLLVHKASHHFDLVNWWLDDVPEQVYAHGGLRFYGPDGPEAQRRAGRVPAPQDDPFHLDLPASPRLDALYGAARQEDGYVRDRDVFSPGVDIEDNMAALVGYSAGASLSYSLNAHAPWEGYRVALNGTEGRIELDVCERAEVIPTSTGDVLGRGRPPALDPSATPEQADGPSSERVRQPGTRLVVQRHWEPAQLVSVPESASAHGGGDDRLLSDIFRGSAPDPLGRRASHRDGIRSVVVGAAANRALSTGRVVRVDELGLDPASFAASGVRH